MFNYLTSQRGKYFGKDKKLYYGEYLFTIDWCHPESNILDTEHSEIPHEHKCGHVIALDNGNFLFNLIIVFFGILAILPLETTYQTIRFKLQNGMSRIKVGLQRILDKMFYKIEDK